MVESVNIEAKNLLAKLLATENIWIQHRKVLVASFDLVNRILIFPMWKEMSDTLYTMLAGHEVGHALYSFDIKKGKRVNVNVLVYAKRIDPTNTNIAGHYWNIIEDARIERLIKAPYPGLKSIFAKAYQELLENDAFGIKDVDLKSLPLIDRINLYYKIGHLVQLSFTPEEEKLVRKVGTTLTMDDVVAVAKEIYLWSQKNEVQPQPPITLKISIEQLEELLENSEPSDSSSGGQQINVIVEDLENDSDGDKKGSKNKKGKSKKSKKSKKPKKDGGGENSENGEDEHGNGEGDEEDGDVEDGTKNGDGDEEKNGTKDDKKSNDGDVKDGDKTSADKQAAGNEAKKPVDPGPPPDPTTQRTFDEKIIQYHDPNAIEMVYVTLPKPNLKNIVEDFQTVHDGIRQHFVVRKREIAGREIIGSLSGGVMASAEKEFSSFCESNMPKINYILQQFEMRKQADRYIRTKRHKVGSLDTLRLHAYKTEEDLFKTVALVSDGKNHGLLFVVDWSGSMQSSMAGTLEQLILLCIFCRKAQIPFEVYSLTTGGKNAFSHDPGNLVYADNFKMRVYLSSRMTSGVFYQACVNLFALMPNGTFKGGPIKDNLIDCTPLDESIIATIDLMKEFRQHTNAQIVNAIFLTDGGANTVSSYVNPQGKEVNMTSGMWWDHRHIPNINYVIDDRVTHKIYKFEYGEMTPTMVRILRDRHNIHAVCFFIGGLWENFFTSTIDDAKRMAIEKQFEEDGYVISTEWGFDEMYITNRGDVWRVKDFRLKPQKIEIGSAEYLKTLEQNFIKQGQTILKQRLLLDRFVKMIA